MSFFSRLFRRAPKVTACTDELPPHGAEQAPGVVRETQEQISASSLDALLLERALEEGGAAQREARRRLAELLDSGALSLDQLPTDERSLPAVLAIAAACSSTSHFEQVAARVGDSSLWTQLAVYGAGAKLRQLAAARVEGAEALRAVLKAARERDKSVYRIAKAKLDALHAVAKQQEQQRAHMQALAETIERHSFKPFDGAYVATLEHLEREWRGLNVEVPDALAARVQTAIDRAREVIAEQIRIAGAQAAHQAALDNAEPLRSATLAELTKLLSAMYSAESFDDTAANAALERLDKLSARWEDTLRYKPALSEETERFMALKAAVERLARCLLEAGPLAQQLRELEQTPTDAAYERLAATIEPHACVGDAVPERVGEALKIVKRWRERQASQQAAMADAERQVAKLIRLAHQALQAGRSRQALGIRRSIDAPVSRLPTLSKRLAERLQLLDAKLDELHDWKQFAATPKRAELIARMQALIGADQPPPVLAERIKRLQQEWKALARTSADSEEDWAKFHEAAQAAYAPCKAYFEAQAQLRARNLERRKALVEALTQYEADTDWTQADWREVANRLRAARQEWRESAPSGRAATKPLQKQFDECVRRIQERLDAQYAANIARKQALVERARELVRLEDAAQAASAVKALQAEWRGIGVTPRDEDQRLWAQFKTHCDAAFDTLRKQRAERRSELERNEQLALELCAQLEALAHLDGAEPTAAAARMRELREAFERIEALPRERVRPLRERFDAAIDGFNRALDRLRERELAEAWNNFFAAAERVRLHQLSPEAISVEALRREIDAVDRWPKGGKQAIEAKLARPCSQDAQANERALRHLTIRAELASGAETPECDQSQRRALQLDALVNRSHDAGANAREVLESLAFEWIKIGPVPAQLYEALHTRFRACWARTHGAA